MSSTCFRKLATLVASCIVVLLCSASSTRAWGCKGHQTVAIIAGKQMTSEAKQYVDKLLTDNPPDPQLKRYCGNSSRDPMADASTWPDDVRNDARNGPWHYINIPRGTPHSQSIEQFCGSESCITKAIADQLAIFRDPKADPRKRADALRYLIHFVGDLHMPLHAITNNDQGGTCVPVRYFRRRPREHNHAYTPNLHALWDTAIVERDMEGADPPEYSDFLTQLFTADTSRWQQAGVHVDNWAWESFDLAETFVYGELAPPDPLENPAPVHSCADDNNIGDRMLHMHFYAGQNYQEIAAPIVEERLTQAGVRLAMMLNDAVQSFQPKN